MLATEQKIRRTRKLSKGDARRALYTSAVKSFGSLTTPTATFPGYFPK